MADDRALTKEFETLSAEPKELVALAEQELGGYDQKIKALTTEVDEWKGKAGSAPGEDAVKVDELPKAIRLRSTHTAPLS